VNKKKRGRKPKDIPSQTNKEVRIACFNIDFVFLLEIPFFLFKNVFFNSIQGLKKKIGAAPPGFIHPMYLMNLSHG